MTETLQSDMLIDAILTIANDEKSMKILEPNVMQPLELEKWMVARTLMVLSLILEEIENDKSTANV